MKFLGANGTIVAIILIGAILMFIGVAYPFGIFENLDPRIVPTIKKCRQKTAFPCGIFIQQFSPFSLVPFSDAFLLILL